MDCRIHCQRSCCSHTGCQLLSARGKNTLVEASKLRVIQKPVVVPSAVARQLKGHAARLARSAQASLQAQRRGMQWAVASFRWQLHGKHTAQPPGQRGLAASLSFSTDQGKLPHAYCINRRSGIPFLCGRIWYSLKASSQGEWVWLAGTP